MRYKIAYAAALLALISAGVQATTVDAAGIIANVICDLVPEVINLAYVLALLMFIYAGAKYAFSADDPGGRKKAKSIAVQAIVGFLIVGVSKALVEAIAGAGNVCP